MEVQLKIEEYRSEPDFVDMLWIRGSRTEQRTVNRTVFYKLLEEHRVGKSVNLSEVDKEILDWVLDKGGKTWMEEQINSLVQL